MISDYDLATYCQSTYNYAGDTPIQWDEQFHCPGGDFFLKRNGDIDVIVAEGTHNFMGWMKNFDGWAKAEITRPALGPVHPGFYSGLEVVWEMYRKIARKVILTGHSRGAAQVAILAGIMVSDGLVPAAVVGFGEPKSGEQKLKDLLAVVPYQKIYINCDDNSHRHDYVTDVPYTLPGNPYCRRVEPTNVTAQPLPDDPWGPFAWHHIQLYKSAADISPIQSV